MQVFLDDSTKEAQDIETLKVIEKRIRDVIYKAEDKVDASLRSIVLVDIEKDACHRLNLTSIEENLKNKS
ncbi:hypothetical protein H5410_021972 [Solanum commersonii]|uniref:Uncharacterized protein n=1 Tax=Solanum commersonii TaxID=4109 RepID=A0A9J5ZCK4_SOLCO|nr:hypothetical protein H5410_021972 [Solanum commersonii]